MLLMSTFRDAGLASSADGIFITTNKHLLPEAQVSPFGWHVAARSGPAVKLKGSGDHQAPHSGSRVCEKNIDVCRDQAYEEVYHL